MPEESKISKGEEDVVLGLYFDSDNHDSLFGDCNDSDSDEEVLVRRNADPVEDDPKPEVEYETKVPGPSTIIYHISQRRVDRIIPEQATRTDACLPCARDTATNPKLELYKLPCHHAWCKDCLARAFQFALHNHAFKRLQCCTEKEIPLSYFERIMVDKQHSPPQYETQAVAEAGKPSEQTSLPGLRDWNPVKVVEYVEKDRRVFISTGDMASYKVLLEEHETLPRSRVYCCGKGCGQFVPKEEHEVTYQPGHQMYRREA